MKLGKSSRKNSRSRARSQIIKHPRLCMKQVGDSLRIAKDGGCSAINFKEARAMWGQNNRPGMTFKERIIRFMSGRNGPDKLYNFLVYVCLGLVIINIFVQSYILSLVYAILFSYSIFRVMSRNIYKRRTENAKFVKLAGRIAAPFKLMGAKWRDRKTHVYRKCAHCKKVLRLPKKKGEHTVNCPVCHRKFNVKI